MEFSFNSVELIPDLKASAAFTVPQRSPNLLALGIGKKNKLFFLSSLVF